MRTRFVDWLKGRFEKKSPNIIGFFVAGEDVEQADWTGGTRFCPSIHQMLVTAPFFSKSAY